MTDPSWAAQKAIFGALNGNLTYGTASPADAVPVYDAVPQAAAYPYVVLESQIAEIDDPLASRRDVRFFYLSVWSTYTGQKEVVEIMQQIDTILANARLTMESGRMVRCYVIRKRTMREPDNVTFMGQVTLRMLTEH